MSTIDPMDKLTSNVDEPSLDAASKPDEPPMDSVRSRTQTEKGKQYQIDLLKRNYSAECKKVQRQRIIMSDLLESNNVDTVNQELANLDKKLSAAEEVHCRIMPLLSEEEQNIQHLEHEELDTNVFETKRKACQWLKDHDNLSVRSGSSRHTKSQHSHRSNSNDSKHSSKSNRSNKSKSSTTSSKLAYLKAEEEALEEAQKARKEELECMMKLEAAKMETQRTRLKQKIVKVKLQETDENLGINQTKKKEVQNHSDVNQLASEQTKPGAPSITEVMSKLIDLQMTHTAPDVEIDIFSGNHLEYHYFRATFRDVVERNVSDPRGRFTRLLKYTSGEAKEVIRDCINEEDAECFNIAIQLLDNEYGNKQLL